MTGAERQHQHGAGGRRAVVITVSDGVAAGSRQDESGEALAKRLGELGFSVERAVVPDDYERIVGQLLAAAPSADLIATTGGTGLGPRDVTPQATRSLVEYEVPGFGELMRLEGGRHTPMAYLSRGTAGRLQRCLVVNLPGSPKGALESLAAIEPLLDHALATMSGPFDHDRISSSEPSSQR